MERISIKGTHKIPNVLLDADAGLIEMKGRAIIENPTAFFVPLETWLNEYIENPKEVTVANFDLEYYNTSSAAYILRILKKLERLHLDDKKVLLNWVIGDEEMLDAAKDYTVLLKIPFNLIEVAN